jgi:hypothetical protein
VEGGRDIVFESQVGSVGQEVKGDGDIAETGCNLERCPAVLRDGASEQGGEGEGWRL